MHRVIGGRGRRNRLEGSLPGETQNLTTERARWGKVLPLQQLPLSWKSGTYFTATMVASTTGNSPCNEGHPEYWTTKQKSVPASAWASVLNQGLSGQGPDHVPVSSLLGGLEIEF